MRPIHATAFAVAACALAACATPAPAPPTEKPAEAAYDGPFFKRAALVVSDMDRALSIYEGLLGFQSNGVTESSATSYSYPVFNIDRGSKIRFATLNGGPNQIRTLALAEVTGQPIANENAPRSVAVVVNVNGRLEEILGKAKALGLETVDPVPLNGGAERGVGLEGAFVDYDGHLVVMYEFPVSEAPNVN